MKCNTNVHKYEFSRVQYDVDLYTLVLPSITNLKTIVTAQAKADIASMAPFDLYKAYGTHFVNSLLTGGRAIYSSSTNKYAYKSSYSLDVVAQMSYKVRHFFLVVLCKTNLL